MSTSALVLLTTSLIAAAPPQGDLKKVEGTWRYITVEVNGKAVERDDLKDLRIVVHDGKYTVTTREGQLVTQGRLQFHAGHKPGQVDAVPGDGEYKGQELPGIYELKGDTWRMAFAPPGKPRPTDFRAGAGVLMRYEMKRVKK